MNRNESMSPKEKFVAAKRVEAESFNGKKNEASNTVKDKSSSIQCWKCKGFGHMSKECVNEKVMVIRNGILDSDDECEDHDSQLVEEIAAYDDVNSQALISFTLGRYKDEVLCDVVPMHVGDILFGRP